MHSRDCSSLKYLYAVTNFAYENQLEGNGESCAWAASYFVGQAGTHSFTRIVAPRLSNLFLEYADVLRIKGQLAPGRKLARIAQTLAPNYRASYFVQGKIWYDDTN